MRRSFSELLSPSRLIIFTALAFLPLLSGNLSAQTWVDSLDRYAREQYMPPGKYVWTWQRASLLRTMVYQYGVRPSGEKEIYLDYVLQAMESTEKRAHGKRPNAVASGHGMAFLARELEDEAQRRRFMDVALRVFEEFKAIIRVPGGGVSHKARWPELWDDTVYMVGVFLLEMYRATGEEKYLDHLVEEIRVHRQRLLDTEWGLWVHGWDGDDDEHIEFCGKKFWPDETTRRSREIWGRGNGWVVVTLSDAVRTIPEDHPYHSELGGYLLEMIGRLPELQDKHSGHWYQLTVRKDIPGNFIESSSTAMFGYGILTALQQDLVPKERVTEYRTAAGKAYHGLRRHSVKPVGKGPYLTSTNVCKGTCIGDMQYYLNRKSVDGKHFGLAMLILFGMAWELENGLR